MRKILLLTTLFVLSLTTTGYGADVKMAVCDLQAVVEQSAALKELYATMEKRMKPVRDELEKERAQLAKDAVVLQDPKATKEKRDDFITRQTAYMEKTTEVLNSLKDSELEARLEMDKLVLQAAEVYAKKNKYDVILDTQGILYPNASFAKASDVTKDMVKEVNELWQIAKKK